MTDFIRTDIPTALLQVGRLWEEAPYYLGTPRLIRRLAYHAAAAIEAQDWDAVLLVPADLAEIQLYEGMITDEDRMFSDVHGADASASEPGVGVAA